METILKYCHEWTEPKALSKSRRPAFSDSKIQRFREYGFEDSGIRGSGIPIRGFMDSRIRDSR